MQRSERLTWVSTIVILGFLAGVVTAYVHGVYLGWPYPYNTFLFLPRDRFMDYFHAVQNAQTLDPYFQRITSNYFPFAYFFLYVFSTIFGDIETSHAAYLILFTAFFAYYCLRGMRTPSWPESIRNVVTIGLLSVPYLFILDRSNTEGMMFAITALFLIFHEKGNARAYVPLLAMSVAMKAYTGVFLLFLLSEKRYREIAATLGLAAAASIGSAMLFNGGISRTIAGMVRGFSFYQEEYVIWGSALPFGHSIYGFFRVLFERALELPVFTTKESTLSFTAAWGRFAVLAFGGISYLVAISRAPRWKKVGVFVLSFCLLPHTSPPYRLILIFLPLVEYLRGGEPDRRDRAYCTLFALALVPKAYYYFEGTDIGVQTLLDPVVLTALLALLCVDLWRERATANLFVALGLRRAA